MIILKRTCSACPEQYDAYIEGQGEIGKVGYLRLRHGYFRVDYPDCGGETIYQANPRGDGIFDDDERDYYLKWAVHSIEKRLSGISCQRPPPPDVQYKIME